MVYGYARVSTEEQDLTGARAQLKAAGCQRIYRENITGTTADRLSRDTTDLLNIARDVQRAGAGIRSLAEPFLDTTSDFAGIVFAILGVAAKLEHRRIKERTARGRADAKAKGVKFGRKPKLTPHQQREAVRRRDVDGETLRSIGRSYMSVHRRFRGWWLDQCPCLEISSPRTMGSVNFRRSFLRHSQRQKRGR